jgi:hypothetical protein
MQNKQTQTLTPAGDVVKRERSSGSCQRERERTELERERTKKREETYIENNQRKTAGGMMK